MVNSRSADVQIRCYVRVGARVMNSDKIRIRVSDRVSVRNRVRDG